MKPEERVIAAWNKHMRPFVRASKGNITLIRKAMTRTPDFVERYEEAVPYFQDIDDSYWSTGRVCFHWSLRGDHVERCLADGYRLKSKPTNQYKTPLEQTMKNIGLDYHDLGGKSGTRESEKIYPGDGKVRRQLESDDGRTGNKSSV